MANPQYNKMMKQVQEMQRKMAQAQEELAVETVEASAGGGMVRVVISGALEIKEVHIMPEAVDPDDVEMLQDLVVAATNEALAPLRTWPPRSSAAPPAASTCPTSQACSDHLGRRPAAVARSPAPPTPRSRVPMREASGRACRASRGRVACGIEDYSHPDYGVTGAGRGRAPSVTPAIAAMGGRKVQYVFAFPAIPVPRLSARKRKRESR